MIRATRTTALTALALLAALSGPAVAAPPAPTPEAEMLLGAIDVMITPATLKQAGITEAWATAVVDDIKARRYLRARAIGALAIIGTDSARARIERAASADHDLEIRIQAVISLARAFGPADEERVNGFLKGLAPEAPEALRDVLHRELTRLEKRTKSAR